MLRLQRLDHNHKCMRAGGWGVEMLGGDGQIGRMTEGI
jgi:hypothetical protein